MTKKLGRETVTYIVWFEKRDKVTPVRRITVPASWRVTLGMEFKGHDPAKMLRFYEGTLQRACLKNVTQFCDEAVKVDDAPAYEGLEKLTGTAEMEPLPY